MPDRPSQGFTLKDTRRSRFIMLTTYAVGAFVLFAMASLHWAGLTEPRRLAANASLLVGVAVANLLCRRGRVVQAAHVLIWAAFLAVTVVCYATGGFRSPASNIYLTIVAFAGWLLGGMVTLPPCRRLSLPPCRRLACNGWWWPRAPMPGRCAPPWLR